MKKAAITFFTTLITAFTFNVNAQWTSSHVEADEFKGIEECTAYVYKSSVGDAFVCWDKEKEVKIVSSNGIFDYRDKNVVVVLGFYEGDKLVEKVPELFYVSRGNANTATSISSSKKPIGLKIIKHLKTKGSVRFYAPRYGGNYFDLTVPMNEEIVNDL